MQDRLDRRQAEVNEWANEARQQIFLSVAVGLLGLAVGLLQSSGQKWAKGVTVGIGFCVSGITLLTNKVYTADYRSLQKSVAEATPIIEDLKEILLTFDPAQSTDNQKATEVEFVTKCGKIDLIGQRLRGFAESGSTKQAGWFQTWTVYAQSAGAAPPNWVSKSIDTDNNSTFFVGSSESRSLPDAKAASANAALLEAAHWLKGEPKGHESQPHSEPPPQLVDLVRHAADVSDTWFSYTKETGTYRYYTRLRLSNEFKSLDLKNTGSEEASKPPVLTFKLPNDSAVSAANSGLLLLLKHMGAIPISADLYVLSGTPKEGEAISPYLHNRAAADTHVAKFKSSMKSCKGGHDQIGGYTVWCFHVDESSINRLKGKAQQLGTVSSNGQNFDLFAVDFNSEAHSIEIEVRGLEGAKSRAQ